MEIVYSSHAVERMGHRDVSTTEVEQIIRVPDGKIKQSRDKWIHYKKIADRIDNLIAVVLIVKTDFIEVLTIMNYFEVKNESNL